VLALDLAEASVKIRTGPPSDEPEDVATSTAWAGVLPIHTSYGTPEPCPLLDDAAVPEHISSRR
jgi:hypothetical protein